MFLFLGTPIGERQTIICLNGQASIISSTIGGLLCKLDVSEGRCESDRV